MSRKIAAAFIFILLLFAGIIAMTQETDAGLPGLKPDTAQDGEGSDSPAEDNSYSLETQKRLPEWVKDARWFRSNAGGMAIEEVASSIIALKNEYALAIDLAGKDALPEYLYPYFNDEFYIEIRMLFENGEQTRTQWIFRDANGTSRVVAVFTEAEEAEESETYTVPEEEESAEDTVAEIFEENNSEKNSVSGFIEIYDENSFLTTEYKFLQDGGKSRTDYVFRDGLLISSVVLLWEEDDDGGKYARAYADFFRYNRSLFLRAVERVFYKDSQFGLNDSVIITFPGRIMEAAREMDFIGERHNSYPEFFGDVFAEKESAIVYSTDGRGRVLTQTFYDEYKNVIWVINNTWQGERIVSTLKTEGAMKYLAEYEYNRDGDRVLERNYTNGNLDRVVRTEGKIDIEELYLNGVVVMRAVWEDGRKIAETRMR